MTSLHTLIGAAELAERIGTGNLLIVDSRFDLGDPGKGERDYREAHIPGAVYAHLDRDLSDLSKRGLGRHPVPDDSAFSALLERWGWHADLPVVIYDDANAALAAARLWWLLRLAGHVPVAVLDGGLGAWRAGGFVLDSKATQRTPSGVQVALDRSQMVGYDELLRRRQDGASLLLDARAAARYRGEVEPIDAVAGHIPGALNRPFGENLSADGRFKPASQLGAEFEVLLAGRGGRDVIHMCGSGVTACHNLLAMEHAGLTGSRVFAPSWSGWISDPARAVVTRPT